MATNDYYLRVHPDDLRALKDASLAASKGGKQSSGSEDFLAKGFTQLIAKLAVVATVLNAILKPLQGTIAILGAALEIFFRPFGLFLNTLLRPLSIALLIFAVKFYKDVAPALIGLGKLLSGIIAPSNKEDVKNLGVGGALVKQSVESGASALGGAAKQWADSFWKSFNEWDAGMKRWSEETGAAISKWVSDFGLALTTFYKNIEKSFKEFYEKTIIPTWNSIKSTITNIGTKLKELVDQAVSSARSVINSIVSSVKSAAKSAVSTPGDLLGTAASVVGNLVKGVLGKDIGGSVPANGMYALHRGEQVVSSTQQQIQNSPPVINVTIPVSATINNGYDVRKLAQEIKNELRSEVGRRTTYANSLM